MVQARSSPLSVSTECWELRAVGFGSINQPQILGYAETLLLGYVLTGWGALGAVQGSLG